MRTPFSPMNGGSHSLSSWWDSPFIWEKGVRIYGILGVPNNSPIGRVMYRHNFFNFHNKFYNCLNWHAIIDFHMILTINWHHFIICYYYYYYYLIIRGKGDFQINISVRNIRNCQLIELQGSWLIIHY